jgi:hypothetical protein
MKKTNHPDRQGMILIAALVLLFVLSSFVTAAAVAVRVSYEFDDQSARTSTLRRALDAAIARSRTRLTQTGPAPLNLQGTLQDATYHVRGTPVDETTYRLHATARLKSGQPTRCVVHLQVTPHETTPITRLIRYGVPNLSISTKDADHR